MVSRNCGQCVGGVWGLLFFLAVGLLAVPSVFAVPLGAYCVLQVGKKPDFPPIARNSRAPSFSKPQQPQDQPVKVSFEAGGESLQVVTSGVDILLLKRSKSNTLLSQVRAAQPDFGRINSIIVIQGGRWLWIDGDQIDYVAPLERHQNQPALGTPIALPELYVKPCPFWLRFFGCSSRAQGIYSGLLDRVFITGHRPTFFGRSALVSLELVAGRAKPLPAKAQGSHPYLEVQKLGGILLRGPDSQALFYDGYSITSLSAANQDRQGEESFSGWYAQKTENPERVFLVYSKTRLSDNSPVLTELKGGPRLVPISLPEELPSHWLRFFSLPSDSRVWGVTRHSIVVEGAGKLHTVIVQPPPYFIDEEVQAPDGSIWFTVQNKITGASTDYSIMRASTTTQCKATLKADQPILLGSDQR